MAPARTPSGLIREYFLKGTTVAGDQDYLSAVAAEMSSRPRRIPGYRTPAEVFTKLPASSSASTG